MERQAVVALGTLKGHCMHVEHFKAPGPYLPWGVVWRRRGLIVLGGQLPDAKGC